MCITAVGKTEPTRPVAMPLTRTLVAVVMEVVEVTIVHILDM